MQLGTLSQIRRYPVKSMVGEVLDAVSLEAKGDQLCYPILLWADTRRRGGVSHVALRNAFLERQTQHLENELARARAVAAVDEASGLPARASFEIALEHALAASLRHRGGVSLCIVEFRGLGQVTDVVGEHVIGGILGQLGREL